MGSDGVDVGKSLSCLILYDTVLDMETRVCDFAECGRPHRSGGLCSRHWAQRHAGKELAPIRTAERGSCSVVGCERPYYGKGYCAPHYRRWHLSGVTPIGPVKRVGKTQCSGPQCARTSSSQGLCPTHYAQHRRGRTLAPIREHGNPLSSKALSLRNLYKMSLEEFREMNERQAGGCAICGGRNEDGRELSVDHDHACCPGQKSCGECIRALLCSACNFGIGSLGDDPERLIKAAEYVRCHR